MDWISPLPGTRGLFTVSTLAGNYSLDTPRSAPRNSVPPSCLPLRIRPLRRRN